MSYYINLFLKINFSFAEWAIFNIKSRLYRMLRGALSQNWIDLLDKICDDYNNTPIRKLGWLKPIDIINSFDSYKVKLAKNTHNITTYHEPNYKIQNINQKNYEKDLKNLQINDYVYLDSNKTLFGKSFDTQVFINININDFFKFIK